MNHLVEAMECVCCGKQARFTILLATAPNDGGVRYYIPNQNVREVQGTGFDHVEQVPFCHSCIRTVEDNFRTTIATLQKENSRSPAEFNRERF